MVQSILRPIIQNQDKITFCSLLSKEDRLVWPQTQTATEIYNHWRAYNTFPGTSWFDDYFKQEIKLLDCSLELTDSINQNIFDTSKQSGNWLQYKINKKTFVFHTCMKDTLLLVKKICLQNGKQIDMSGFQFDKS